MEFRVQGKQTIDWVRPARCPAGLEPRTVTIGPDIAGMGLEVAVAAWSGTGSPTREAMASLHGARLGRRLCPVVVVAESGDQVWAFGPNSQAPVVGPLPGDQASRLLQASLDQPSGLLARQRLSALYEALDGTAMPGVANVGLFATHELRSGARRRSDWADATETAKGLLALRREALIKALGFSTQRSGGHALVLATTHPQPRAVAVLLEETEAFDAESARFAVSPIAYGLSVAVRQEVPWLIVERGSQLRLYPAKPNVGVGRKGQAETYFELDLALLTDETAGFLPLVFSGTALDEGGSAAELLGSSAQYAVGLSQRLRTKVYDEVVPSLSLAIAGQLPALGHPLDRAGLDLAYQLTLRTFFRLLFQAYAEDRKLLPYGENPRYDRNALNTVAKDLTENPDQPFDTESTALWDDLAQVWKVIDKGDSAWSVPPYNGGLFSTDPELHPEGALLAQITVTNDILGPALRALLIDTADDGTTGPIDFRSLSIREFGTIYEGLLESNLALADVDLTLGKDDTWLPAGEGDVIEAPAGSVYFHNTSGQRKGTGSYFTPTFVVEHLLERALDPALDAHLARIGELLRRGDTAGAARDFFDFRVADLAMGSAHFLTAAIDHIEAKLAAFLAEHDIPGVSQELRHLEGAAREASGPDAPDPEPSSLLRRQIARRCIYGLDVNPVAVELSRVSIWIHTFVRGLPMSSLDHNLVCANSLTGIGSVEEALDALVPGRKGNQLTMFDRPIEEALDSAREVLADVAAAAEATRPEAEAAARAALRARSEAETARLLFDAAVLIRIGDDAVAGATEPDKIAALAGAAGAQSVIRKLNPAHFPYLFPEVFLRERPGFDVLLGNPPWEKVKVEEHNFWALRFPGLRAMPASRRREETERLALARPDLARELEDEIAAALHLKQVLFKGPFPGISSGDPDLYKAFAWRFWHLVRDGGDVGVVLPRQALAGTGSAPWREAVLSEGTFSDVTLVVNSGRWVFGSVHAQYSIGFVSMRRTSEAGRSISMHGPFSTRAEFDEGMAGPPVEFLVEDFITWTNGAAFPLLPTERSAATFLKLRKQPRLDVAGTWRARPVRELHATDDRDLLLPETAAGSWPVYKGESFELWNPDTGTYLGRGDPEVVSAALQAKRLRQQRTARSAFAEFSAAWAQDASTLPCLRPRITFRDISRATDTRTVIAALVPGERYLTHLDPYILWPLGDEGDEAFLLGVLCSIPLDWYARRVVENHVSYQLLNAFPVPRPERGEPRRERVIAIAGRLAAIDERYADWASAIGVEVGSVADEETAELLAEIDALVAHLYGLDSEDLSHIFETFHRGWDYQPRLELVLSYFDRIGDA